MNSDWTDEEELAFSRNRLSEAEEAEYLDAWDSLGVQPKDLDCDVDGRASASSHELTLMKSCIDPKTGIVTSKRVSIFRHGTKHMICRRSDLTADGRPDVGTLCLVPREFAFSFFLAGKNGRCLPRFEAARALLKAAEDALSKIVHTDEDPNRLGMVEVHIDALELRGAIPIEALFDVVRFMGEGEECEAYEFRRALLRPPARAILRALGTEAAPVETILEAEALRAFDAGLQEFAFPVPFKSTDEKGALIEIQVPVKDWFDLPRSVRPDKAATEERNGESAKEAPIAVAKPRGRLTKRQILWIALLMAINLIWPLLLAAIAQCLLWLAGKG